MLVRTETDTEIAHADLYNSIKVDGYHILPIHSSNKSQKESPGPHLSMSPDSWKKDWMIKDRTADLQDNSHHPLGFYKTMKMEVPEWAGDTNGVLETFEAMTAFYINDELDLPKITHRHLDGQDLRFIPLIQMYPEITSNNPHLSHSGWNRPIPLLPNHADNIYEALLGFIFVNGVLEKKIIRHDRGSWDSSQENLTCATFRDKDPKPTTLAQQSQQHLVHGGLPGLSYWEWSLWTAGRRPDNENQDLPR
ncbi:hypothetical protein AVEN_92237-1 [Araneus ventricosus]|uniref:Uncharacterized protein n=1 Tax=Araneus ventricosus TaxID=182803 RepID=A0A4Y2AKT1_ARAVE|nr:hypothetical protein AVEN_92237-1 [Araneus ventricosus]